MRTLSLGLLGLVLPVVLGFFAGALAACAEDARPTAAPALPRAAPDGSPPATVATPTRAAPPRERGIHDLAATVVDDAGDLVIGRPVTLMDARGKRTSILTDEGGTFHVEGVVPPYDVAFDPAPSGPIRVPVVYLGLTREEPRFELVEHDGAPQEAAPQTLRVTLHLPPCPTSRCWAQVATWSPSGSGGASRAYAAGESLAPFEVDHRFRTGAVPCDETIDVHVLAGDEGYAALVYGHNGGIGVRAGATTEVDVGTSEVDGAGPVMISAQSPTLPGLSALGVGTWLELPGGGSMALQYVAGPALVTRVPQIAGARFRAGAWAEQPLPGAGDPIDLRASFAWSGRLEPRATQVLLDLPAGPELVAPRPADVLSGRAPGIVWTPPSPAAVTVGLYDVARGRYDVRVHTGGGGVAFHRLERLGLPPVGMGEHVIDVTTRSDATVDDLVVDQGAPDAPRASAGAVTYQRFAFVVTR